jgi:hypothetical protein
MSDWREAKRDANRAGRFGLLWVVIVIIVTLVIGGAIWALNVATSGPRGQGDALIEQNSAENWTAAQARFEDLYADIEATDRKITVAGQAIAVNPNDKTAQQTYAGTVNYCLSVVGDYNAEARKYLAADFRASDLPTQIDNNSSATDCKE